MPIRNISAKNKKKTTWLYLGVAVIVIVIISVVAYGFISTPLISDSTIAGVIDKLEMQTSNVEPADLSMFPQYLDLRANVTITNPSAYDLDVSNLKTEIFVRNSEGDHFIGSAEIENKLLQSDATIIVPFEMRITSTMASIVSNSSVIVFSHKLSARAWVPEKHDWTITKEKVVIHTYSLSWVQRLALSWVQKPSAMLLQMKSGSMYPTIQIGDLLFVQEINPSEINAGPSPNGDIIVFHKANDPSVLIVHRAVNKVLSNNVWYFTTQGDANSGSASWEIEFSESLIVGRVVDIIHISS